jgi:acyl-CoA thioesterase-1
MRLESEKQGGRAGAFGTNGADRARGIALGGRWLLAVLGSVALVACGGDANRATPDTTSGAGPESTALGSPAAPSAATRGPRVVVLGTSLTAGLGLDPDSAWPALVQRTADSLGVNVRLDAAGLSGETSAGALRRAAWVLREPADVVILEVGANDGLRGVNPDSTRETLVALVDTVRAVQPAALIALVQMEAPPNLGADYTATFRAAYPEAARRTGVRLLPFLLEGVAGESTLNQSDGIHPNEAGSRIVAATMWRAIAPLVAEAADRRRAGAR